MTRRYRTHGTAGIELGVAHTFGTGHCIAKLGHGAQIQRIEHSRPVQTDDCNASFQRVRHLQPEPPRKPLVRPVTP